MSRDTYLYSGQVCSDTCDSPRANTTVKEAHQNICTYSPSRFSQAVSMRPPNNVVIDCCVAFSKFSKEHS